MTNASRKVLEDSGIVARAQELVGGSLDGVSQDAYLTALLKARNEGAGTAYRRSVVEAAGGEEPERQVVGEAIHRTAESYLKATGREDYSQASTSKP